MTRLSPIPVLIALLCVGGCGLFGGLRVETVATSAEKPSNVAVYLTVSNGDSPVPTLSAKSFRIYEDGQLVPAEQSSQTLLDRNVAAAHHALLLLDLSGKLDEPTRRLIATGAAKLVEKVAPRQGVTVYGFDGSSKPALLADFDRGTEEVGDIPAILSFRQRDPSSNLYGAVIEAVNELDARLMAKRKPLRVGTLVVLARGPDLAGRATAEQMEEAIEGSNHYVLAIGVGEDRGELRLDRVGPDGTSRAESASGLAAAFEDAADRAVRYDASHYLLAYCSPARSGRRALEVEVVVTDAEGREQSGRARGEFDATGFGPGCEPTATPHFVVQAPAEEEEEEEVESNGAESRPGGARPPAKREEKPAQPGTEPAPKEPEGSEIVPPPSRPGYAPDR